VSSGPMLKSLNYRSSCLNYVKGLTSAVQLEVAHSGASALSDTIFYGALARDVAGGVEKWPYSGYSSEGGIPAGGSLAGRGWHDE